MIINQPLSEEDLIDYVQKINTKPEPYMYRGERLPKSQREANIYALNNNVNRLTDLTADQLLRLPARIIPNPPNWR